MMKTLIVNNIFIAIVKNIISIHTGFHKNDKGNFEYTLLICLNRILLHKGKNETANEANKKKNYEKIYRKT